MSFAAQYRGECASCFEPIEVGQEVQSSGGYGRKSYVHVVCPDVLPAHKNPVCENCFIEKPCECDDS